MKKTHLLLAAIMIAAGAFAQSGNAYRMSKPDSPACCDSVTGSSTWIPRFGMGIHVAKVEASLETELTTTVHIWKRFYVDNAISTEYVDGVETYRHFSDQISLRYNCLELDRHTCVYHIFGAPGIHWQGDFYDEPKWWKPWNDDFRFAMAVGAEFFLKRFPVGFSIEVNSRGKRGLGSIYMANSITFYFNK